MIAPDISDNQCASLHCEQYCFPLCRKLLFTSSYFGYLPDIFVCVFNKFECFPQYFPTYFSSNFGVFPDIFFRWFSQHFFLENFPEISDPLVFNFFKKYHGHGKHNLHGCFKSNILNPNSYYSKGTQNVLNSDNTITAPRVPSFEIPPIASKTQL